MTAAADTATALPDALSLQAREFVSRQHGLLIGAEHVQAADGRTFATLDPANGREIARVAHAGVEDVDRAVFTARSSFEEGPWPTIGATERERLLRALADAVEQHAGELAEIESLDNGKPVGLARHVDVRSTVAHLRYFAGWPTKIEGALLPVAAPNMHCYTRSEPVGVCAQIVPWNFPLLMAAWKIAPALAAGCTIVLKPAEQTPLSALRLGEFALEVGFPPGVLNVLTGDGSTGAALVEHPGVDKVAFTGSTAVGREIGAKAGRALKRVTLELGGKSPNVILADADIEAATAGPTRRSTSTPARRATPARGCSCPPSASTRSWARWSSRRARRASGPGSRPQTELGSADLGRAARPRDGLHRLGPRAGRRAAGWRRARARRERWLLRGADAVQRDRR